VTQAAKKTRGGTRKKGKIVLNKNNGGWDAGWGEAYRKMGPIAGRGGGTNEKKQGGGEIFCSGGREEPNVGTFFKG